VTSGSSRSRVVIAGGHGKIALLLSRLLADAGTQVTGLIRNPDHRSDLREAGAEPVILDLEHADVGPVAETLTGADAVVFAAGAGPGSGVARKDAVDRAASVLVADAAQRAAVRRVVQISAMGLSRAEDPEVDEVFAAYLRAKDAAERDLAARDLDWTILRPGRLTDEPGTGLVTLAEPEIQRGAISRQDVAAVLVALLPEPASIRRTFELVAGPTPIADAVSALR
jgi:uncharacterized protein YbjT (DUF2867 family)